MTLHTGFFEGESQIPKISVFKYSAILQKACLFLGYMIYVDHVKFVACTLVSRDSLPFCKYICLPLKPEYTRQS